jgi:Zn-dependent protease
MDRIRIMESLRFPVAVIVFSAGGIGLSYLANYWVRHRKRPDWVGYLISFAIALLWTASVIGYILYDAARYSSQHPHDDAPGMVVMSVMTVGIPLFFFFGLFLAFLGALIAHLTDSSRTFR